MREKKIPVLTIRRAANGYIVETTDPMAGRPSPTEDTVYVFANLAHLDAWLSENFSVE